MAYPCAESQIENFEEIKSEAPSINDLTVVENPNDNTSLDVHEEKNELIIQPEPKKEVSWGEVFGAAIDLFSAVDNWAGTPCPHCGHKSMLANFVGKKEKGLWDALVDQTKVECKNCGKIFVIKD